MSCNELNQAVAHWGRFEQWKQLVVTEISPAINACWLGAADFVVDEGKVF